MSGLGDKATEGCLDMAGAIARVPTTNGAKYVNQLCKHWSHKLEVDLSEGKGSVRFPSAFVEMKAGAESILVEISADNADEVDRMKGVVSRHLDRFAFREAPLLFEWQAAGTE